MGGSQRNISMLLRWVLIALVLKQRQGADQLWSRLGGFNYFINESAFGGDVWVGEFFFELVHTGSAGRRFIRGFSNFASIQDINRSLSSHHRNLCRRPGEVDVGAN